jgi:transcriptional regulator with XRE-family HTH domain
MRVPVKSVADVGMAVRAVRRHSGVRIDDLAATTGVSKQFTQDVEHGKPTVQFDRVLKVLNELGIPLALDIPDEAAQELEHLRAGIGLQGTYQRRRSKKRP